MSIDPDERRDWRVKIGDGDWQDTPNATYAEVEQRIRTAAAVATALVPGDHSLTVQLVALPTTDQVTISIVKTPLPEGDDHDHRE